MPTENVKTFVPLRDICLTFESPLLQDSDKYEMGFVRAYSMLPFAVFRQLDGCLRRREDRSLGYSWHWSENEVMGGEKRDIRSH